MSMQPGTPVTINGLAARPELNGTTAVVTGYDSSKDRYNVQLQSDRSVLSLKSANLTPQGGPGGAGGGGGFGGMPGMGGIPPGLASFVNPAQLQQVMQQLQEVQRIVEGAVRPLGVSVQQAGMGVVGALLVLNYFVGFVRTLLFLSALALPLRLGGFDRLSFFANKAANKLSATTGRAVPAAAVAAAAVLLTAVAYVVFMRRVGLAPAARVAGAASAPADALAAYEEGYAAGYADAKNSFAYGSSKDTSNIRSAQAEQVAAAQAAAAASPKKGGLGIGSMVSMGFLSKQLYDLSGGGDLQLLLANVQMLPAARKLTLAMSVMFTLRSLGLSPI